MMNVPYRKIAVQQTEKTVMLNVEKERESGQKECSPEIIITNAH